MMFITNAYAQAAGGGSGDSLMGLLSSPVPVLIAIFVIMYFMMIRPQQQRQRQHREMIANIRRGDTIVTTGGLIGKVAKVDETEIQIEVAEDTRVRIVRGMIAEVRAKGEPVKEGG
jgi:preprotein translocase subunit YajC